MNNKRCKMCCKEIDRKARKCPYCHHWQNKISLIIYHPAFMVLPLMLMMLFLFYSFSGLFVQGENFAPYKSKINVINSELKFGEIKGKPTVVTIGKIENKSQISWKDIQFELNFFDEDKKLIDGDQKRDYFFVIPANATSTFKVSLLREFPIEKYKSHKVKVLTAKDNRSRF